MADKGFRYRLEPYFYLDDGSNSLAVGYRQSSLNYNMIVQSTQGATTGGTRVWIMTPDGECLLPLQPSGLNIVNTSIAGVTGDNTTYTAQFVTQVFDRGTSTFFSSTTYTAPKTGIYELEGSALEFTSSSPASYTQSWYEIVTSGRTYRSCWWNWSPRRQTAASDPNQNSDCISVIAPMTAGDTAQFRFKVNGPGKNIEFRQGSPNTDCRSWFSANLIE